jgi:hypothetical protein
VQTLLSAVNLSDPERKDDYIIIYIIHTVYLNIQQSEIYRNIILISGVY